MTEFLEGVLKKVAFFQRKYAAVIVILVLLLTSFLSVGITKINLQSDFNSGFPDDIPIIKTNNEINDKFGGQDVVLILIQLDEDSTKDNIPNDIRDPRVVKFLVELEKNLRQESEIESVQSLGFIFANTEVPETLSGVKTILSNVPQSEALFNTDYSVTFVSITVDVGSDQDKIKELNQIIQDNIDLSAKPAGVKAIVTGGPTISATILDLLVSDAIYTLILAAVIIFGLLIVVERSFAKAFLIFFPLLLGVSWTLGTMGWLSIDLSIATVGIGAMILGLGVEYGAFFVGRYKDERKTKDQLKALQIAVSGVGSSILGSGLTTVTGFLALTLSVVSFMRDLGLSLALGIGFSLIIAIFINPSMMILEENFEHWLRKRRKGRKEEK